MIHRCAFAVFLLSTSSPALSADWSNTDKQRQTVYTILHLVDWGQSRHVAKNPDLFYETNGVLGRHPDPGRVDRYFALTLAAHYFIADWLPPKARSWFQRGTIVLETGAVAHNFQLGVRIDF